MYDKYTTATQFSVNGSQLPKHKGILLVNNDKSNKLTATLRFLTTSGGTADINFYLPAETKEFVPMQAWAGVTMSGSGLTGWLLN